MIHRRARYRHAWFEASLYQFALSLLVVFASSVAFRSDNQTPLQTLFLFAHVHLSTFAYMDT